jgi:riboflavin synthase
MFTGIVASIGRIVASSPSADGVRIDVDASSLNAADIAVGESIAVNGCCLTVVALEDTTLRFDVSAETLACTTGFDRLGPVNLERSMRLSDRLGGHLVSGHVDGAGTVVRFERSVGDGSALLEVEIAGDIAHLVARKGSIAVDGVSLTVNEIFGRRFSANLIPHTLEATTLGALAAGSGVNVEVDLFARYVERLLQSRAQ